MYRVRVTKGRFKRRVGAVKYLQVDNLGGYYYMVALDDSGYGDSPFLWFPGSNLECISLLHPPQDRRGIRVCLINEGGLLGMIIARFRTDIFLNGVYFSSHPRYIIYVDNHPGRLLCFYPGELEIL